MANITVIEDDKLISRLVEKILSAQHSISLFHDGAQGLTSVKQHAPDLLVLDVSLPQMSGFDIAAELRQQNYTLPILMLTARDDLASKLKGLEHADDYLSKPFAPQELRARVEALLRRSGYHKNNAIQRDPTRLEGQVIRNYKIVQLLGHGGMASVYKAYDEHLKRYIALKFFRDTFQRPEAKDRFMREAVMASRLSHPNVNPVFGVEETEDGLLYMVMPFLTGSSLNQLLKHGLLEIDQTLDYAQQIAQGLAAAHKIGVVHRDVKPANIMIEDAGTVRILDFGVASWHLNQVSTLEDGLGSLTTAGEVVGTLNYIAPEQLSGRKVDGRADIWSLGMVFYEMLTGFHPFHLAKDVITMVHAITRTKPKPPHLVRKGISIELSAVVLKALNKNPAERFQTMGHFATAIAKIIQLQHLSNKEI